MAWLFIVALVLALAYLIHERLDLARFNKQARDGDGVLASHGGLKP